MEEKFFTSTSNFFKWVTEVADKGGLKILTLGTHDDTYWVKFEVKVIVVQPDVKKSCTCLPSERYWNDIIQKYCRKCEATIIE